MARGNAVMKAKRTTGPTPNEVLRVKHAQETCGTCGMAHPLITRTRADGTIERTCRAHEIVSFDPFNRLHRA
jgi:hypothetical protein